MKYLLTMLILVAVMGGCATRPTASSLVGVYSSNPIPQDSTGYAWTDGASHTMATDFSINLLQNGRYWAGWTDYLDGQVVRFSGLAAYDLRTNSQGTWRYVGGRILLRSDGPSLSVTRILLEQHAQSFSPEASEAKATYVRGALALEWLGNKYLFRGKVPNQSLEPMARSVTPALAMAHH